MLRWSLVLGASLLMMACGPAHMGTLSLSGERDMQTLVLGGWDGQRLILFNDTTIEPFLTESKDVARYMKQLSGSQYAAVYFETAKLPAKDAEPHSIFCPSAFCIAVLERNGGSSFASWGEAAAIIELKSLENAPIGAVWINEKSVRPPGPSRWPLLCREKSQPPRYVHPDGGALFPAMKVGKASFAHFAKREMTREYLSGFSAPSEKLCDEELVRLEQEPPPERPQIKADPTLMQK